VYAVLLPECTRATLNDVATTMAGRGEVVPQDGEALTDSTGLDPLFARAQGRIGLTLRDKWRLDVLLGVGGMAAVYAATHRNGSRAAVKILHPEMSTNAFMRERFLWEGYVANSVGHPGAVRVIDDDAAEDGSLFLVTELLDGETLEERRARLGGRLSQNEVLLAVDQLLDVLAIAHAKGIVHRDLKPENVFLTRAGQIKVLDFGIARLRELSSTRSLTESGAMVGTPAYMPPEHARGLSDEVDEQSDLWGCGAMMFHLLSGGAVHEGRSVTEQLVNAVTKPAPSIATVAADISPTVVRVVDCALAFTKDKRWPDARRMQAAVREAYYELCGSPITSAPLLPVPDTVPDRTLPPVPPKTGPAASVAPTTRPVGPSGGRAKNAWFARRRLKTVAIGAAVSLGIPVIGVVWMLAGGSPSAPAKAAAGAPQTAAPEPSKSASVTVASVWAPPAVAASELPVAEAPKPPTRRGPPRKAASSATSPLATPAGRSAGQAQRPEASPRLDCQPPYVVDVATGKKEWKPECL
jgi:serine/threonine protein kinase